MRGYTADHIDCQYFIFCVFNWSCSKYFAQTLGLAAHVFRICHQNALTKKAWEDAIQGLGNQVRWSSGKLLKYFSETDISFRRIDSYFCQVSVAFSAINGSPATKRALIKNFPKSCFSKCCLPYSMKYSWHVNFRHLNFSILQKF